MMLVVPYGMVCLLQQERLLWRELAAGCWPPLWVGLLPEIWNCSLLVVGGLYRRAQSIRETSLTTQQQLTLRTFLAAVAAESLMHPFLLFLQFFPHCLRHAVFVLL